MRIWIDAQLAPGIASWMAREFGVEAMALRDVGLRDASDRAIFTAARRDDAVLLTKDADFVHLLDQLGPPPRVTG